MFDPDDKDDTFKDDTFNLKQSSKDEYDKEFFSRGCETFESARDGNARPCMDYMLENDSDVNFTVYYDGIIYSSTLSRMSAMSAKKGVKPPLSLCLLQGRRYSVIGAGRQCIYLR